MFRMKYPLSWTFHRNSSSWLPSILAPIENQQETAAFKEMVDLPAIKLPPPQALHRELSETIRARYSCRRFIDAEVPLSALATLLYWSYGKLGIDYPNGTEMVLRPVPSGGGLYPLEPWPGRGCQIRCFRNCSCASPMLRKALSCWC